MPHEHIKTSDRVSTDIKYYSNEVKEGVIFLLFHEIENEKKKP